MVPTLFFYKPSKVSSDFSEHLDELHSHNQEPEAPVHQWETLVFPVPVILSYRFLLDFISPSSFRVRISDVGLLLVEGCKKPLSQSNYCFVLSLEHICNKNNLILWYPYFYRSYEVSFIGIFHALCLSLIVRFKLLPYCLSRISFNLDF